MSAIPEFLRRLVIDRAGDRCEYCRLAQVGQEATFHIDHIIPQAAGGETLPGNLALACVSCSLRKGARRTLTDPATGELCAVFNPREDHWDEHFSWSEAVLVGTTPKGRALVEGLSLNRLLIIGIRAEEHLLGRHPPKSE